MQIVASNWVVRLSPILIGAGLALFLLRKRIRFPEFVRSGMALAVAASGGLLLILVGFLIALFDAVRLISLMRGP
jgi:hypothetical protein